MSRSTGTKRLIAAGLQMFALQLAGIALFQRGLQSPTNSYGRILRHPLEYEIPQPSTISVSKTFFAAVLSFSALASSASAATLNFNTPGAATWTVPAGVSSASIVATGAGGGGGYNQRGGNGGVVTVTFAVTAGQVVNLFIGGHGPGTNFGGGGGGSTNIDAGTAHQIIAGGAGGGAGGGGVGGNGNGGTGGAAGNGNHPTGGQGGSNGVGGAGGLPGAGAGLPGGNGNGGAGGIGGFTAGPGGLGQAPVWAATAQAAAFAVLVEAVTAGADRVARVTGMTRAEVGAEALGRQARYSPLPRTPG